MRYYLLLAITATYLSSCSGRANQLQTVADNHIPVKLIAISGSPGNISIEASGVMATELEARLSFKIAGVIENVFVREGQRVKKGQLLASIKETEISAQQQQVQLAVEKSERDYARALNLYRDSVATLEQLQNARTSLEMARQSLQVVSFNRQYSRIYAPGDGFITRKLLNAGEVVSAGTPVLLVNSVSERSKWILRAGVADREWSMLEVGNRATVTLDAFTGKQFNAILSKKALAADPSTGAFQVELQVEFDGAQPAVGMYAKANISINGSPEGYTIPYEALLEANGKRGYVFVSDDQQTVKKVPVLISSINNNSVNISEGLSMHRYVVVAGSPYLLEGASIKPVQ